MTKQRLYKFLLLLMMMTVAMLVYEGAWHALIPLLVAAVPLIQELTYEEKDEPTE